MTPPASAIYTGTLRHRRFLPREHAFAYGIYHVLLDLDDLHRLDRDVAGFGYNRRNLTTFHDHDHLGPLDLPIREKLRRFLAVHDVTLPSGPITLLTNLRVLGYVFNPVSWFYCHDDEGNLELIVAEVGNTFGEHYCYLLTDLAPHGTQAVRASRAKRFHVSPFMDIEGHYDFTFRPPGLPGGPEGARAGDPLAVHMDVYGDPPADGGPAPKLFDATLGERRVPLTSSRLLWTLVRHPLMSLHTIALIHWQAARLWIKRFRFFHKPDPPDNRFDDIAENLGRPGQNGGSEVYDRPGAVSEPPVSPPEAAITPEHAP